MKRRRWLVYLAIMEAVSHLAGRIPPWPIVTRYKAFADELAAECRAALRRPIPGEPDNAKRARRARRSS